MQAFNIVISGDVKLGRRGQSALVPVCLQQGRLRIVGIPFDAHMKLAQRKQQHLKRPPGSVLTGGLFTSKCFVDTSAPKLKKLSHCRSNSRLVELSQATTQLVLWDVFDGFCQPRQFYLYGKRHFTSSGWETHQASYAKPDRSWAFKQATLGSHWGFVGVIVG